MIDREEFEEWLGALHRMRVAHTRMFGRWMTKKLELDLPRAEFQIALDACHQHRGAAGTPQLSIDARATHVVEFFEIVGVRISTTRIIDTLAERLKAEKQRLADVNNNQADALKFLEVRSWIK